MSITGIHPETTGKNSKKIIQWRNNDSGEIDVFEAAKYFSGANEEYYNNGENFYNSGQNLYNNNNKQQSLRGGRMSFDMPMMRNSPLLPTQTTTTTTYIMEKPMIKSKDQKKYKQPSSPGGRLANFLNSLFNQTSSKKKKSSKSSAQSLKDEDESPSGRRKRRSSISHFSFRSSSITTTTTTTTTNTTTNSSDSKSIYSSLNSGFRTPPPYTPTPTKSYKDFRTFSDQQVVKYKQAAVLQHEVCGDKKNMDYSWLDEKLKLSKNNGEKYIKSTNSGLSYEKSKTYNKVVDVDDDDGADSDSSSDLFDLPNIDLDFYSSSGLPVYETTHMDNIKRGAPISSGGI